MSFSRKGETKLSMTLREKIEEACHYNALCGGNYELTCKLYKTGGRPTLTKYVLIGTHLSFCLLDRLDMKGKEKISIGFAELLAKKVFNTEHQLKVFDSLKDLSNKDRMKGIDEETECPICCENKTSHEFFKCCNSFVCCDCVFKHLDISLNSIVFEGCKCPMCSEYMTDVKMERLLILNSGKNPERTKWIMRDKYHFLGRDKYKRLYVKWKKTMKSIQRYNEKEKIIVKEDIRIPQKRYMKSDLYYGICSFCCPGTMDFNRKYNTMNVKVKTIEKSCVNGEGDIVVLKKDMFQCEKCSEKEKEENIFKKCPHCGIKTLKPDGCKYVICGDHRWCWICNERLPNNHEGHNVHYWMGPGSGPYADVCRRSENYNADDFVLKTCDCKSCLPRGGAPLCRETECMNTCPVIDNHQGPRFGFELTCGLCS